MLFLHFWGVEIQLFLLAAMGYPVDGWMASIQNSTSKSLYHD